METNKNTAQIEKPTYSQKLVVQKLSLRATNLKITKFRDIKKQDKIINDKDRFFRFNFPEELCSKEIPTAPIIISKEAPICINVKFSFKKIKPKIYVKTGIIWYKGTTVEVSLSCKA